MTTPTPPPAGTPSLKQLVAQAMSEKHDLASMRRVVTVVGRIMTPAELDLFARLSPETVLAVYENLYHIAYSNPINPEIYAKVALDLLDGGAS